MFKNVASQKLTVFAFDSTTNLPKTGDAANITAYVDKDDGGVTVLTDTTATEKDATNAKGYYIFDLAQAETNGDKLTFSAKSSTANIVVIGVPAVVYTLPAGFTSGVSQTGDAFAIVNDAAFGNAKLVRSTAPANTLDVSATGEAGLDFNNLKQATGATTLTNIRVPNVTLADTVTTYTGNTPQTGDAYPVVSSGTFGNSALLSAIQNVQNNTFIATSVPGTLERPDAGSATVNISIVFSDETGAAKNLDSGSPAIALVNDAGADLSSRLGAITNPATGKYVVPYTNASGDALEGLHWDITGTVNTKARRMVAYTQIVDTTAIDFTAADRTKLNRLDTDYTTVRAGKLDNLDATVGSRSTYAGTDTAGTTTLLGRLTIGRASNLDNLDASITSRMATFVYTAPDNAGIATLLVRVPDANLSTMAVHFLTMIELDGSVYRYTANALELAPAGGGGGAVINEQNYELFERIVEEG